MESGSLQRKFPYKPIGSDQMKAMPTTYQSPPEICLQWRGMLAENLIFETGKTGDICPLKIRIKIANCQLLVAMYR